MPVDVERTGGRDGWGAGVGVGAGVGGGIGVGGGVGVGLAARDRGGGVGVGARNGGGVIGADERDSGVGGGDAEAPPIGSSATCQVSPRGVTLTAYRRSADSSSSRAGRPLSSCSIAGGGAISRTIATSWSCGVTCVA
jgi:hypothetical protein